MVYIVFAESEDFMMWPKHFSFRVFLFHDQECVKFSNHNVCMAFSVNMSLDTWPTYEMVSNIRSSFSFRLASFLFSNSGVKVNDSQAYKIWICQGSASVSPYVAISLNRLKPTVACAIFERTSGFEPSSKTIDT